MREYFAIIKEIGKLSGINVILYGVIYPLFRWIYEVAHVVLLYHIDDSGILFGHRTSTLAISFLKLFIWCSFTIMIMFSFYTLLRIVQLFIIPPKNNKKEYINNDKSRSDNDTRNIPSDRSN